MTEVKQTSLTKVTTGGSIMAPDNIRDAMQVAEMIAKSGMVPESYRNKPGAVLVAMQMGIEVGLPPLMALQNIAVINGRPALWGDAVKSLIVNHPDCESFEELAIHEITDRGRCTIKRRGRKSYTVEFTLEMAKAAGLLNKKGPWQQYRQRMLQMRARGFCARDEWSDVLMGLPSVEEARDIPRDTKIYDAQTGEPQEGRHAFRGMQVIPDSQPTPGKPATANPEPQAEQHVAVVDGKVKTSADGETWDDAKELPADGEPRRSVADQEAVKLLKDAKTIEALEEATIKVKAMKLTDKPYVLDVWRSRVKVLAAKAAADKAVAAQETDAAKSYDVHPDATQDFSDWPEPDDQQEPQHDPDTGVVAEDTNGEDCF